MALLGISGSLVAAAVILLAGWTGLLDRLLVYFPDRDLPSTPAEYGLAYEDVTLTAEDGVTLRGWFVPGPSEVTWLWLHGNAGNISHRLPNIQEVHDRLGVSILIFDYRGYGGSGGSPSEAGIQRDAAAALACLRARRDVQADKIVYFGRSLGGAVAVELAARHRPYGLVLEAPLPSTLLVATHTRPWLPRWLASLAIRARFDALSKIGDVGAPLLVIHGDRDQAIPMELGRTLYDAASEPKRFYVIPGASHNDTYSVGGEAYYAELERFHRELSR
jgi:fermentation-respiration switch protein FrsA (DUF1100 family)